MWLDKNVVVLALSFIVFLCLSLGIVFLLIRLRNVDKRKSSQNKKNNNIGSNNVKNDNIGSDSIEENNLKSVKDKESCDKKKENKDDTHKNKTKKPDNAYKSPNNEQKNKCSFFSKTSIDQPYETNNQSFFDEINKIIDNDRELLESLKNDAFVITRGNNGNVIFIYSLKINDCPEEVFANDSSNDLEKESSVANLRKAVNSTLNQYISARTPESLPSEETYIFPSTANLFLRLLYKEKDSFIGKRMDSDFMPLDAFHIVCKVIRKLIGYYGNTLTDFNSKSVMLCLYELEDNIRNFNSFLSLEDLKFTYGLELLTVFMTYFFAKDYLEFVQDVNKRKQDFEERKEYLKNECRLKRKPILLEQSNPEMEYDFLDFVIYICSQVLTNVISKKIF